MRARRIAKTLAAIGAASLLVVLLSSARSVDGTEHERFNTDLLTFKESHAALNEAVLRTRYGMLVSYDPLNAELAEIRRLQGALRIPPGYLSAQGQSDFRREFEELAKELERQDVLIQEFKSQNAVINNSLRYFPIAARDLVQRIASESGARGLTIDLHLLVADLLGYSLAPKQELATRLRGLIDRLGQTAEAHDPATQAELLIVLNHATTILDRKLTLDNVTRDLISVPTVQHAERLYQSYSEHHEAALASSLFYRLCLYLVSTVFLCLIIQRLRNVTRGLRGAQQGLEREIHQRTRAESELRRREGQLVDAQRIAGIGDFHFDVASGQVEWSDNLWELYGLEPSGRGPSDADYLERVHPDDRAVVRNQVERALRDSAFTPTHHRIVRLDGTVRVIASNGTLIYGENGEPIAVAGISQDVTHQKEMEEELKQARDVALESARLKAAFLANTSHEIRTPMNGVIGMTELLLDTELDADQRDLAETIRFSAGSLLTIINDVLDFSKIEAGLLRFEKIDFDFRAAVEASVEQLAEKANAKGVELVALVLRDVPTALQGDPGRVRQVLLNLIGNAVKFTERGEVVVRVTKVGESASRVTLRVEVRDTGIGISAEAQRGLFHPFTQADGSTTRKYGGTGLGLAISKQMVELMAGEIGIESTPGVGSMFWFTAQFEKQPMHRTTKNDMTGSLAAGKLLIVDDSAANRGILHHQADSLGMIAVEAESGGRALELLRGAASQGQPYDLAVVDETMPLMDGLQLAAAISADPSIAAVPLVLLRSGGRRAHGDNARPEGVMACLQKPVRQSQLHDCLISVMAGIPGIEPIAPIEIVTGHSIGQREAHQVDTPLSKVRIIVAEDNFVNQKVALRQLSVLGYRAEAVRNGRELLEAMEIAKFDLVLMDCQMPEMDGFAATVEIRRLEGDGRRIPIIAMTANAFDGDERKCLVAGMDDYLSKPVDARMLRQKLEHWIGSAVREPVGA